LTDNYIRGKYLALGFVRDIDLYGAHSACEAAALGQKRPLKPILAQWLLSARSSRSWGFSEQSPHA